MTGLYQKYLDNLTEGHALLKENLMSIPRDRNELLTQIRETSRRIYELRLENDAILHEILYSRSAETLSAEEVETLKKFADTLFVFSHQNDIGTAYRIHQLLFAYAEHTGDYDLRIRQLYHMGVALYYMNPTMVELGVNPFGRMISYYFREGSKDMDRCRMIENPETQAYILRSFTNFCDTDERFICPNQPGIPYDNISSFPVYDKQFKSIVSYYEDPENRKIAPAFNWDSAIYNLHFNRSLHYRFVRKHHPKEIMESILESAEYTYSHQEQIPSFRYSTKEIRVAHIYTTTRWLAGKISTTQAADELYDLIKQGDENDFSLNGISRNVQLPLYFEQIYDTMNREQRIVYRPKMLEIDRRVQSYLLRAPHNEYSHLISNSVGESVRYRAKHGLPLQKKFFDALLFCHPPTYIHVRMTAHLSRRIFSRMAEVSPEMLLGLFDIYDVNELRARRKELAERVYNCALYHDVGKIMLLDFVGIYDRKLLPEEFESIKLHTIIGASILEKSDHKELSVIALHHHRFYNEMGGYPDTCPPCPIQYKPLVDIITVADSIEAATDNVGRCYSAAKSFPELVEELRAGAGTRYSPHVVALFDDPNFFARVERGLHYRRESIYFETYGNGRKEFFASPDEL